jgi:hypothetical protein
LNLTEQRIIRLLAKVSMVVTTHSEPVVTTDNKPAKQADSIKPGVERSATPG